MTFTGDPQNALFQCPENTALDTEKHPGSMVALPVLWGRSYINLRNAVPSFLSRLSCPLSHFPRLKAWKPRGMVKIQFPLTSHSNMALRKEVKVTAASTHLASLGEEAASLEGACPLEFLVQVGSPSGDPWEASCQEVGPSCLQKKSPMNIAQLSIRKIAGNTPSCPPSSETDGSPHPPSIS